MKCPACQAENREGARFCRECGATFGAFCSSCGAKVEAGSKFCDGCGAPLSATGAPGSRPSGFVSPHSYTPKHLADKILTSKSALEGERKQVTVLFADVSGYTSISDRLDPEIVHGLMTRAFQLILTEVHRYEGTVNQFLGDGIMALFGAPIAHEDHALRAVLASLGIRKALEQYQEELRRTHGIGFQVRQGLNTGLVVVGSIGDDLRMDYTAVGDTTNVAARLQQAAERGRIFISAATHRLVTGHVYTRPLGPLALKGKPEPSPAWEVISARPARARLDILAEQGLTAFVGRERELRLLAESFERVKAGQGQVVFLVGEPGIGKSRLLYEFRRHLDGEATWLEGHSLSFGHSIAFHPVIDLLKRNFRIDETDTEQEVGTKIDRSGLRLGEDLRPILPYLRYLLSVDPGDAAVLTLDPSLRRKEILEGLMRLTFRAAEIHPQVIVYEDLQWMDKATEEYLALLGDSLAASPVLLVLSYRAGYGHPFGERSYHTRIPLGPLSERDSVEIARSVLAAHGLPEELHELLVRKAEGNPFFVEEVVRSLREVGVLQRVDDRYVLTRRVDEVFVPDTIQDVIMARIDRLEETAKKALQFAAVIGREFTRRLLDRIAEVRERTEQTLRDLKALELIYERALFPEPTYVFKHALTHDVAYNSLLIQRRQELHRTIGLAIEELYGGRLVEHYEMLAYHFVRGEDWTKAVHYLRQAGAKAEARAANREAVAYFEQALQALARLPDGREKLEQAVDVRFDLRRPLFQLGEAERMLAYLREAASLAETLGDGLRRGWVLAHLGGHAWFIGDQPQALALARHAYDLAVAAGDFGLRIHAAIRVGWGHHALGEYRRAVEFLREGAALEGDQRRERFGHVGLPSVMAHSYLAWCLAECGDLAEALTYGERALAIADEVDHAFTHVIAGVGLAVVHLVSGTPSEAIRVLERGHRLAAKVSVAIGNLFVTPLLGLAYARAGRVADGLPLLQGAAEFTASRKLLLHQPLRVLALAEGYLTAGRTADAATDAVAALELARRLHERGAEAQTLHLLAEIAAREPDAAEGTAADRYREALALAETLGMRPLVAHCHFGLGRVYRHMGKRRESDEHFAAATSLYREVGMTHWLEEAKRAMD